MPLPDRLRSAKNPVRKMIVGVRTEVSPCSPPHRAGCVHRRRAVVDAADQDQRQRSNEGDGAGGEHRRFQTNARRHRQHRDRCDGVAEKTGEGVDRKGATEPHRRDLRREDRVIGGMKHAPGKPNKAGRRSTGERMTRIAPYLIAALALVRARPRAWWRDFQDSRHDSSQDEDALIGRALHQHKLHFSEVYGLRRDQSGRIFLKNDRLVFHEGE